MARLKCKKPINKRKYGVNWVDGVSDDITNNNLVRTLMSRGYTLIIEDKPKAEVKEVKKPRKRKKKED